MARKCESNTICLEFRKVEWKGVHRLHPFIYCPVLRRERLRVMPFISKTNKLLPGIEKFTRDGHLLPLLEPLFGTATVAKPKNPIRTTREPIYLKMNRF